MKNSNLARFTSLPICCLIIGLSVTLNLAQAATLSWSGGGGANANWNNSANWGFAGAPANGDTLVFPAAQPNLLNTNNIASLVLNQIRFAGAGGGYDIRGNAFTITNNIQATNTAGVNTIENAITFSTTTITANVAVNLTLSGALGGSVGLTKTGVGTLVFSGAAANTYSGTTTVNAGTLQLNRTAFNASIVGDLVIGDGSGTDTVELLANNQIDNTSDLTINEGGVFDGNTFLEVVNDITMTGGSITGSGSVLQMTGDMTVNPSAVSSSISKPLALNSVRSFTVADGGAATDLSISGIISGGGGISKAGVGVMTLSGANTYTGATTVNAGTLNVNDDLALGGTAGATVVNGPAALILNNAHVTNEVLTLNSTNPNGALQVNSTGDWIGPITLQTNVVIEASSLLQLGGLISGPGGFTKIGANTLRLLGTSANSYAGDTIVNGGTLELNVNFNNGAIPGDLTINGAFTVRLLDFDQFNNGSVITINTGGLLDVNGFNDIVGGLVMTGGTAQSGVGTLRLNGNLTVNASATPSTITGGLELFGASIRTFNISGGAANPDLEISAIISGSGGITVNNSLLEISRVVFSGANTYSGLTTFNNTGSVSLQNASALGSPAAGTVLNGPNMAVSAVTVMGEGLTNISPSTLQGAGAAGWTGPIVLNADLTLQVTTPGYVLDLSGVISGPGGIEVTGAGVGPSAGTVIFSGISANSYTGGTFVEEGTLELAKATAITGSAPLVIGDGVGGISADVVRYTANNCINASVPIIVDETGLLDLNGFSDTVGVLTLLGGDITTGAGTLTMNNNLLATYRGVGNTARIVGKLALGITTRTFTVTNTPGLGSADLAVLAEVSGTGGILKTGDGLMTMSASNSFTGTLTVNDGEVDLQDDFAAGTTAGGVIVNGDATLALFGNIDVGAEALTLNSTAVTGSFTSRINSNSWAGTITLSVDSVIKVSSGDFLNLLGAISGAGGVTKVDPGTLIYSGSDANTYAGLTTVNAGTLVLGKSVENIAVAGNLVIGDGSGGANADVVRLQTDFQLPTDTAVIVNSSGRFDLNGIGEAFGSLAGSGNVTLDGAGITVGLDNTSTLFSGVISETGSITKVGSGTMTLTGNNSYTGPTTIFGGTLLMNGFQPQSQVSIGADGTLGGIGTVGAISASGTIAPGTSPGILVSSNVTFVAGADYFVELNGPTPGAGYDQLNVRGINNSLGNAVLQVTPGFTSPVGIGDQFVIINNDGVDAITGTFNGLAEGATITAGFFTFTISYIGGDGNDVVLTLTSVPLAQGGAAVTSGNGNHVIDPNECNNLSLVISNQTGAPMTGITATLSALTPHVLVAQPASAYPNVPANGQGTNTTAFQISTTPHFVCGTSVSLELTVASASHGAFSIPISLPSGSAGSVPVRYDVSIVTNIPDVGTIESTNSVAAFGGPITKVVVSLWLTHGTDADLDISLISPDGVVVDLSSGNGGGANFGTACAPDGNRTTFDDAAGTSITAGASPFTGTFQPEGSLAGLVGGTANGNWRLRVTDNFGGGLGALRCWSLFLYGPECTDGQGFCETCLGYVTNSISSGDLTNANRLARNGITGTCAAPLFCGGEYNSTGPYSYDTHTFTNAGGPACVTVTLDTPCDDALSASAYLGSFSPTNLCLNFLGEMGSIPSKMTDSFSISVPGGTNFVIVVNEIYGGSGCAYTLLVSSDDCVPTLVAEPSGASQTVRVHWPTWAGGYNLEATANVSPATWLNVTNEPIVSGGRFNVTNQPPPANRFYRLNKPLP